MFSQAPLRRKTSPQRYPHLHSDREKPMGRVVRSMSVISGHCLAPSINIFLLGQVQGYLNASGKALFATLDGVSVL